MAFKDVWVPQTKNMDALPEIPNMLADAIIKNEADIKELRESGGSGGGSYSDWPEEEKQAIINDVISALPDADKMSFPLEETVSEVSAE